MKKIILGIGIGAAKENYGYNNDLKISLLDINKYENKDFNNLPNNTSNCSCEDYKDALNQYIYNHSYNDAEVLHMKFELEQEKQEHMKFKLEQEKQDHNHANKSHDSIKNQCTWFILGAGCTGIAMSKSCRYKVDDDIGDNYIINSEEFRSYETTSARSSAVSGEIFEDADYMV